MIREGGLTFVCSNSSPAPTFHNSHFLQLEARRERAEEMDSLRKLEDLQTTMMLMQSDGILTTSSDHDSDRFIANLVLFLMQPCGELDLEKKSALVSEYLPKISSGFLEKASVCLTQKKGFQQQILEKDSKFGSEDKSCSEPLTTNYEEMATIGLDAMQRANSTVEDFCRSYFMFHGMDANNLQALFKYLPLLSFTESYIYQLDSLNEKILHVPSYGVKYSEEGSEEENMRLMAKFTNAFKEDPFRSLAGLLDSRGLLTNRIREEFKHGEEYWALERKLCCALANKKEISVEDVIKAIHLKSFDYRVLNLLLYQLRGEQLFEGC